MLRNVRFFIIAAVLFAVLAAGCGKLNQNEDINPSNEKEAALEKSEQPDFYCELSLEGGSGKASVQSPALITVSDNKLYANVVFSSSSYDYVICDGIKYLPVKVDKGSHFILPLSQEKCDMNIIADTTAMSTPHEIEYILHFNGRAKDNSQDEASSLMDIIDEDKEEKTRAALKAIAQALPDAGINEPESSSYAECFKIYRGNKGESVITVNDGSVYLLLPAGYNTALAIDGVTILKKPLVNVYLAATSAMSMIDKIGAMDAVGFSSQQEDTWYVENANKKMDEGKLIYAGKYSQPDYELLKEGACPLAIESTMILHSPQVAEKLRELGIAVFIDKSSYETNPLGRCEWIKVYGELFDCQEEASESFKLQSEKFEKISRDEKSNQDKPTVAYFYINGNGGVVVRKSADYIPKMIEMAGGKYIFSNIGNDDEAASVNMTMESFYETGAAADILIYNGAIGGEIKSKNELLAKCPLIAEFNAFKNSRVYCARPSLYQLSDKTGQIVEELAALIENGECSQSEFFIPVR